MARPPKSSPKSKKYPRTCRCGYDKSEDCKCGCETEIPELNLVPLPFDDVPTLADIADDSSWAFESFFENTGATT